MQISPVQSFALQQSQSTAQADTNAAVATADETQTALTSVGGDFTTFLQLLTAQMRNQDPMKPVDSTEFVAQLASFSSVEQQVRTNELLTGLYHLMTAEDAQKLNAWIGQEVRAVFDPVFDGTPLDIYTGTSRQADRADLVIKSSGGREVQRIPLSMDADVHTWDGRLADGTMASEGSYRVSVETFKSDEVLSTYQPAVYGMVKETRLENGAVILVLASGAALNADNVSGLRAPDDL